MLSITPVNVNSNYHAKKQNHPAFGAFLKIRPETFENAADAFNHSNSAKIGFIDGAKMFFANAKNIYHHFGFDGLKCLHSESFKGKTNLKVMSKILAQNVLDGTGELPGKIILGSKTFGGLFYGSSKNNLALVYKTDVQALKAYTTGFDRAPEVYFPKTLSVENINRAVANISNDAETAFKMGNIIKTKD